MLTCSRTLRSLLPGVVLSSALFLPQSAIGAPTAPAANQPAKPSGSADKSGDPKGSGESGEKKEERGWEWFWLSGEGGIQYLGLESLSSDHLVPGTKSSADTGPMMGMALGIRLFIVTLGVRARYAFLNHYNYWSVDPEIGLRFGWGSVQPYLLLGGGYSALGAFESGSPANNFGAKIRGFNIRAGAGLDFYVSDHVSLGLLGTAEIVAMTRPGVTQSDLQVNTNVNTNDPNAAQSQAAAQEAKLEGSSLGVSLVGSAVLGFHF